MLSLLCVHYWQVVKASIWCLLRYNYALRIIYLFRIRGCWLIRLICVKCTLWLFRLLVFVQWLILKYWWGLWISTGLWLVKSDHMSWILASDWLILKYWWGLWISIPHVEHFEGGDEAGRGISPGICILSLISEPWYQRESDCHQPPGEINYYKIMIDATDGKRLITIDDVGTTQQMENVLLQ